MISVKNKRKINLKFLIFFEKEELKNLLIFRGNLNLLRIPYI